MAEARSRQLWDHTSELLAMLANGLLQPKGKAFAGRQFHPFDRRRPVDRLPGEDVGADGWIALKAACKGCKRRVMKASDVRVAKNEGR